MAAAYRACGATDGHRRRLPAAHGEDQLWRFVDGGALDVAAAAAPGGFSKGGFAYTYRAAEVTLRLLTAGEPPRRGPRADLRALRSGLGDVLDLAREPTLSEQTIIQARHLCPCRAADAADGEWLRQVMFERAESGVEGDRNRQVAAHMLIDCLDAGRMSTPSTGFVSPTDSASQSEAKGSRPSSPLLACGDLAQLLRQRLAVSVEMGVRAAGRRCDDRSRARRQARRGAAGGGTVAQLIGEFPDRTEGDRLRPAEEEVWTIEYDEEPRRLIGLLDSVPGGSTTSTARSGPTSSASSVTTSDHPGLPTSSKSTATAPWRTSPAT